MNSLSVRNCIFSVFKVFALTGLCLIITTTAIAQATKGGKKISPDLFGLFFEDINYSADGGLYDELIQNPCNSRFIYNWNSSGPAGSV